MRGNRPNQKISNRLVAMNPATTHFMALATILSFFLLLLPTLSLVDCQDFEDLTNTNNRSPGANQFQAQSNIHTRQPQQQIINAKSMMRPVLSSRFAPTSVAGQQQLLVQASQSSATVLAANVGAQVTQQQPSVSNIEQLMKNALARTAQTNSAVANQPVAAENRQDLSPPVPDVQSSARSGPAQQVAPLSSKQQVRQAEQDNEKIAESSETLADTQASPIDDGDRQTTAAQTTTTSGHETVYSDQRFANLFARRGSNKKTRITPMEQIKAKPTLPSFIKSLPDPKQFTAPQSASQDTRPATPSSGNSFASQRIQQQNQARVNQQKKPIITSTSAAIANNKRTNAALGAKPQNPTIGPKVAASAPKVVATSANKPTPSSNNPFSRAQSSNNEQANVIAMARKRLLANNALETAKLKQQQTKPSA